MIKYIPCLKQPGQTFLFHGAAMQLLEVRSYVDRNLTNNATMTITIFEYLNVPLEHLFYCHNCRQSIRTGIEEIISSLILIVENNFKPMPTWFFFPINLVNVSWPSYSSLHIWTCLKDLKRQHHAKNSLMNFLGNFLEPPFAL